MCAKLIELCDNVGTLTRPSVYPVILITESVNNTVGLVLCLVENLNF